MVRFSGEINGRTKAEPDSSAPNTARFLSLFCGAPFPKGDPALSRKKAGIRPLSPESPPRRENPSGRLRRESGMHATRPLKGNPNCRKFQVMCRRDFRPVQNAFRTRVPGPPSRKRAPAAFSKPIFYRTGKSFPLSGISRRKSPTVTDERMKHDAGAAEFPAAKPDGDPPRTSRINESITDHKEGMPCTITASTYRPRELRFRFSPVAPFRFQAETWDGKSKGWSDRSISWKGKFGGSNSG